MCPSFCGLNSAICCRRWRRRALLRRYTTQSVDISALEPDNANGWFDEVSQTLHLVVPTQLPQEVADEMPLMLAKRVKARVNRIWR